MKLLLAVDLKFDQKLKYKYFMKYASKGTNLDFNSFVDCLYEIGVNHGDSASGVQNYVTLVNQIVSKIDIPKNY